MPHTRFTSRLVVARMLQSQLPDFQNLHRLLSLCCLSLADAAAPAGDSRAVLSRSGKAIELTRDHKPQEPQEKQRIELCGGFVCPDGRLCGELAVARAIGDYHFPNLKAVVVGEAGMT